MIYENIFDHKFHFGQITLCTNDANEKMFAQAQIAYAFYWLKLVMSILF